MTFPRQNNFDLIRLFAALQVLAYHLLSHFELIDTVDNLASVFNQFPGVPIFFFISGFLITASFIKNNDLRTFFRNRILRIYPALWVCLAFTVILLLFFKEVEFTNPKFYLWLLAQSTFFQHYSPDLFDSWGVGNPNGSLWSIVVELQFYILLPFLCIYLNKLGSLKKINIAILAIFLAFYLLNHIVRAQIIDPESQFYLLNKPRPLLIFRIFTVTIIWNLFYFMVGLFFYFNFNLVKKYIEDKFLLWLAIYLIYISLFIFFINNYISPDADNLFGFFELILLAMLTFSFAFSKTHLSEKLLKHNDISYGIYIYHMPVINTVIALNIEGTAVKILISSIIVINLAVLSWLFIEKKAIALKASKT
jgi:peptidoglycan/LPS O-acetylase OafA/YrhL